MLRKFILLNNHAEIGIARLLRVWSEQFGQYTGMVLTPKQSIPERPVVGWYVRMQDPKHPIAWGKANGDIHEPIPTFSFTCQPTDKENIFVYIGDYDIYHEREFLILWKAFIGLDDPAKESIQAPPPYVEELKIVKELSMQGKTILQIAEKMAVSESTVKRWRKMAGITRNKKNQT